MIEVVAVDICLIDNIQDSCCSIVKLPFYNKSTFYFKDDSEINVVVSALPLFLVDVEKLFSDLAALLFEFGQSFYTQP